MDEPEQKAEDVRVEHRMGRLLQVGVLLAAAVTAVGGAIHLVKHWDKPVPDRRVFKTPPPPEVSSVPGVVGAAFDARGQGLIQLGVLLLIATPVARVAFSVYVFARQRDRLYIVVTLVVLALLLFSLFAGPWLPGG